MKFGTIATAAAAGAILAHSVKLASGVLKKGTVLNAADLDRLMAENIREVTVARLAPGDIGEDDAALAIGKRLLGSHLYLGEAFTGRVNLMASADGVVALEKRTIDAVNRIDEGLSVATLPDLMRVTREQMIATVKVIPYALPATVVSAGVETLGEAAVTLHPFQGGSARLIMTRTPGFKDSLIGKGETVTRARLETLGYRLSDVVTTEHEEAAIADALDPDTDLTLILGASATSDRADVAPAAVMRAGGKIDRFGMPVDPGNLLFIGRLGKSVVVGLPGCARSPALNGVDWVLERLSARIPVTGADIAAMGVGGLLKEMQGRPQPRHSRKPA